MSMPTLRLIVCCMLALGSAVAVRPAVAGTQPVWSWSLPARQPAWAFNGDMPQDNLYRPVVQGNLVLVGCEHNGALLALDLETGAERWRFYTDGPIRMAPAADAERIVVASDDGHLYCLDHTGTLRWKFRGGPTPRKVLAHERLTSAWPASATPAIIDGKIIYVAGYWPLDGVFVHAVDAQTGAPAWSSLAEYRPVGAPTRVGNTLHINGYYGSGAYDFATGTAVKEKAPPPEKAVAAALPGGRKIRVHPSGKIQCVIEGQATEKTYGERGVPQVDTSAADAILAAAAVKDGYCIVAGLTDGGLVEGLLANSNLSVLAFDGDAARVDKVRRRLDAAGAFDRHRLAMFVADPAASGLPPFIANLIVSETDAPVPESLRGSLRPFGGVWVDRSQGRPKITRREGPPPGSDQWTHDFGNAGNTLSVRDTLVKPPLGSLWYGGPASAARYYYAGHDHGPTPVSAEVIDGRLILQGNGVLSAFDIYTGRPLWESPLPKIHVFGSLGVHSKDTPHPVRDAKPEHDAELPLRQRSRATGLNYVSATDGIYVAAGPTLIRFDPADGRRMAEWKVPLDDKELCWGAVRIAGKVLVASLFSPQDMITADAGADGNGGDWAGDRMPMSHLLAIDRDTGRLLWSRKAAWGFLNRGGAALGGGKVYCIDLLLENAITAFKEAGRAFPQTPPMLCALDLETGAVVWEKPLEWRAKGVVYAADRDILVVPCRNKVQWKDGAWFNGKKAKLADGLKGNMRAFRGGDGSLLWEVDDASYEDPPFVLGDLLITRDGRSFELGTGKRAARTSPLTGLPEQWSFQKAGCNHLIGCDNLITWRTGFFDLAGTAGSMPLRGIEAGCTPTLIPSGGVLNIPNYGQFHLRARTVAMALVHVPDNPFWGESSVTGDKSAASAPLAKHAAFNFGAPGGRTDDKGLQWIPVTARSDGFVVKGDNLAWFKLHPGSVGDWIGATGVLGASEIAIPTQFKGSKAVAGGGKRTYDVRLHFLDPVPSKPGERVFSVALEGGVVLEDFDIARAATGAARRVVREFRGVEIDGPLDIGLTAKSGATALSAVELIAR
jgi:outer membrane protein assembly factor BamB